MEEKSPPTTTVDSGRCTSDPTPLDSNMGNSPSNPLPPVAAAKKALARAVSSMGRTLDTEGVKEFTLIDYTSELYPKLKTFQYPKAGEMNSAVRIGVVSGQQHGEIDQREN